MSTGKLREDVDAATLTAASGWLCWCKSEDGKFHDRSSVLVNSLAIVFGLVDPATASDLLAKIWQKLSDVGFTRFDLGVRAPLAPLAAGEVYQGFSNPFPGFENGAICAGHTLAFLLANYMHGDGAKADAILDAMLTRARFQSGVGAGEKAMEWTDWNGNPVGYEGVSI